MSNIIKSNEDIIIASSQLENLRIKGYEKKSLEEVLATLIPNNDNFQVKSVIGNFNKPAYFNQNDKTINISLENLEKYVFELINPILKAFPTLNQEELFYNYVVFVICHEIEHIYQYLIGNGYVNFSYQIISEAYKNLLTLKISKDISPIQAKLKIKKYFEQISKASSLLERNANIEAYDLLIKVADYENNLEIKKFIETQKSFCLTFGYKGFYNGAVEETYNKALLKYIYETFPKNENISLEEKVRYGLPIDRMTRKKVLKKEFKF